MNHTVFFFFFIMTKKCVFINGDAIAARREFLVIAARHLLTQTDNAAVMPAAATRIIFLKTPGAV